MRYIIPRGNVKVFHKAVFAMAKVGDELYFEPSKDCLSVKALNSSKTAFIEFKFLPQFFTGIEDKDDEQSLDRCRVMVRSLLLPFHSLSLTEKTVDTCIIEIFKNKDKFVVTMCLKHKVKKTFRLPVLVESEANLLKYDKRGKQKWTVNPKTLSEIIGQFQPGQDEVSMTVTQDRFRLKTSAELEDKDQIHTDFSVNHREFEHYRVSENTSITFCLREMRSLVAFADFANLAVTAHFDRPSLPMVLTAQQDLLLELVYVLSTWGDGESDGASTAPESLTPAVRSRLTLASGDVIDSPRPSQTGSKLRGEESCLLSANEATPVIPKRAQSTQKENVVPNSSQKSGFHSSTLPITPIDAASPRLRVNGHDHHNDTTERVEFDDSYLEEVGASSRTKAKSVSQSSVNCFVVPLPVTEVNNDADMIPKSPEPESSAVKKRRLFHRVFEATFNPHQLAPGQQIYVYNSDDEES